MFQTRGWLFLAVVGVLSFAQGSVGFDQVGFEKKLSASIEDLEQLNSMIKPQEKIVGSAEDEERLGAYLVRLESIYENLERGLKGIYGDDDRRNYGDEDVTENQRLAARATAVLVKSSALRPVENGKRYDLLANSLGLCSKEQAELLGKPEERFADEAAPGFCSGFKVGPRRIATAGHCIPNAGQCGITRFVFGFAKDAERANPQRAIPSKDIYKCRRIIGGEFPKKDPGDWVVVEVDRDIDAPQVQIRQPDDVGLQPGASLTVIGYPLGLPVKIAGGANVRELSDAYFVANLDTYGGNSGSAVFNTEGLEKGELLVEGILIRGDMDFEITEPCLISKRCAVDGCRGEDVTYSARIAKALVP